MKRKAHPMANISSRLTRLEVMHTTAPIIHSIMVSYRGQPPVEAFEDYRVKRTAEGYTPQEGWEQLRSAFLSSDPIHRMQFITFDIAESIAPHPPIVTRHKRV